MVFCKWFCDFKMSHLDTNTISLTLTMCLGFADLVLA